LSATTLRNSPRGPDSLAKVAAFVRRDFLIAWSYRVAFLSDIAALAVGAITFYFVGLMVDERVLPVYDGRRATYMEFAAIGIVFGLFTSIGLSRVGAALRREQFMGTLESVLATPTSTTLIQFGSVAYELIYLPIRTAVLFAVLAFAFGFSLDPHGIVPAILVFLAFMPFVWGLGLAGAGASITVRGAGTGIGLAVGLMTLFSGAYFPVTVLPSWLEATAAANPIAVTLTGMREALLAGAPVSDLGDELLVLAPFSLFALVGGVLLFRLALTRERRSGTLGLY
jgi:ABC-type multidrug transport system permease subunit